MKQDAGINIYFQTAPTPRGCGDCLRQFLSLKAGFLNQMINARLAYTTKYRQRHKVLKDEGTKRILHGHLSQSYRRMSSTRYKTGTAWGEGLWGLLPSLFMRFKLCHSRFSLRYSWGFLFYHMTNRYQKQGAIKKIIKITITFVNFRFISSHFRGPQINFRI